MIRFFPRSPVGRFQNNGRVIAQAACRPTINITSFDDKGKHIQAVQAIKAATRILRRRIGLHRPGLSSIGGIKYRRTAICGVSAGNPNPIAGISDYILQTSGRTAINKFRRWRTGSPIDCPQHITLISNRPTLVGTDKTDPKLSRDPRAQSWRNAICTRGEIRPNNGFLAAKFCSGNNLPTAISSGSGGRGSC